VADRLPKLSVWKFSSCDGCQLSLLDCEDELLAIVGHIQIAYFLEATSAEVKGPYDVALVEGSVSTSEEAERIKEIRRQSGVLIAIGACATTGGIQALKNFADVGLFANYVYPHPEYLETLATSTPMSDHVQVDYELQGCPINKRQLLEVVGALLAGRRPAVPTTAVCSECKAAGPRHQRRLRRHLPLLPPRLLRLLRPQGDGEHGLPGRALARARQRRPGAPARLPRLHRQCSRIQGGKRPPWLAPAPAPVRSAPTTSPGSRARAPCS
jgi:coenzyme F420-reducing hydrogenase gamma subunit